MKKYIDIRIPKTTLEKEPDALGFYIKNVMARLIKSLSPANFDELIDQASSSGELLRVEFSLIKKETDETDIFVEYRVLLESHEKGREINVGDFEKNDKWSGIY